MFSADISYANHDFPPKNGPVSNQPVNAYENYCSLPSLKPLSGLTKGKS
jgi:hypothetical protein